MEIVFPSTFFGEIILAIPGEDFKLAASKKIIWEGRNFSIILRKFSGFSPLLISRIFPLSIVGLYAIEYPRHLASRRMIAGPIPSSERNSLPTPQRIILLPKDNSFRRFFTQARLFLFFIFNFYPAASDLLPKIAK